MQTGRNRGLDKPEALSEHQARRREWDSIRGYHQGQRPYEPRRKAGHMTAPDRPCTNAHKNSCQTGAFSNRTSFVNGFFVAASGHGSLRGRNNPPQHLVRSTGAAMSTTSWRTMTPLKAHSRSHPYPRPAGNHYIRDFIRMNLTNGVTRLFRAPTNGTAFPNARHYAR